MSFELVIQANGQVTLPQAVLDHLGVAPGRKLDISLLPNGRIALWVAAPAIGRLRGALRRPGQRPVSLATMQAAIERGAGA